MRMSSLQLLRALALSPPIALSILGTSLAAQPAVGDAQRGPLQSVWASAGAGVGTPGGAAGLISGWYSRGAFVAGGQFSLVQPILFSETHSSVALLAGARTRGSRAFLFGAVGVGAARFIPNCSSSCPSHAGPTTAALALSAQAVANSGVLGLTAGGFGVLGPRGVSHAGAVLSLAAGGFGEEPER